MTEEQVKLTVGSLLHDIGKIVYRSGDGRNHSLAGYEYLKDEAGVRDSEILDCVRYHHGVYLRGAEIPADSSAYLVYYADNIAAAADRRKNADAEERFDKERPLSSIFNILNGNRGKSCYSRQILDGGSGINYPSDDPVRMDQEFYRKVTQNITENLKGITYTREYVNSLLSILEANLTYVPSSTPKIEPADISLYDHLKLTAAAAQCLQEYLNEKGICDYRDKLLNKAADSYNEKMFLLYSMDISGIQNFIYTISSEGALRLLRARSFYLEIMMEHIIDELLDCLSLSRANLIYSGGGHCYLLLPNTESAVKTAEKMERNTNQWLLDTFGDRLYVAGGYVPCSANDLKNEPEGSYAGLYRVISRKISDKKMHRYTAAQILELNRRSREGERECSVCRQTGPIDQEGRCPVCAALYEMSKSILYQDFFIVMRGKRKGALPLPGDKYLCAAEKAQLPELMKADAYVRCYSKNTLYTGGHVSTKLWVGDYTTGDSFEQFAQKAEGIGRIGVLRADVDNLGQTIVYGFRQANGSDRYASLSRTAALSRQLSLFFKCYINQILRQRDAGYFPGTGERNVTIVYSGGDDVFLVGAWNDVIESFMDLRKAFRRFTQNTLSISGGIGLYDDGYPVNIMARETEELENSAKNVEGKDAVTLFDPESAYRWDDFIHSVMEEKFRTIQKYFEASADRGKAFLYHLLELLGNQEIPINKARYVYLLSRMEPEKDSPSEQQEAYRIFSGAMYRWAENGEDRRALVTAIYLYVYLTREKGEENEA